MNLPDSIYELTAGSGYLTDLITASELEPQPEPPEPGTWGSSSFPGVDTDVDELDFGRFRSAVLDSYDGGERSIGTDWQAGHRGAPPMRRHRGKQAKASKA